LECCFAAAYGTTYAVSSVLSQHHSALTSVLILTVTLAPLYALLSQFLVNNAFGVDWASQVKHPFDTGVHTARGRRTRLNSNIAAPQIQVRLRSWIAVSKCGVFSLVTGTLNAY
jgi:hypothetical protein